VECELRFIVERCSAVRPDSLLSRRTRCSKRVEKDAQNDIDFFFGDGPADEQINAKCVGDCAKRSGRSQRRDWQPDPDSTIDCIERGCGRGECFVSQLGISRGSPEQVIDGWRYFGYRLDEGETDADMGRRHATEFLEVLRGKGFAPPNPRPMFPNPPGMLRLEPHSEGLRDRIWWGAASNGTAAWAAKLGMNLQSSTLKFDETGEPFHIQQAAQIRAFRAAWKEAGHARVPRVSVSRSIFTLTDDRDFAFFGRRGQDEDQIGYIDGPNRAIFGRTYAAEPDVLIEQLRGDEAIAEADTLLLTVPNQLGVDYNVHALESILTAVAPSLGWR
jgi:alkanesulfonate monooxygenase SsuD/methylene tetrahydromethanopterin reductase-like flavin-dependent oxidoreductase (luciferase family)